MIPDDPIQLLKGAEIVDGYFHGGYDKIWMKVAKGRREYCIEFEIDAESREVWASLFSAADKDGRQEMAHTKKWSFILH